MPTARGNRSRFASWRLLFTGTGVLLIAMFNPVTLQAWRLRSRFVSPGAALRVWCWDLSVLAVTIVAVFVTGHRVAPRQDQDRPTPPLGARVPLVIAAGLVSALLGAQLLRSGHWMAHGAAVTARATRREASLPRC